MSNCSLKCILTPQTPLTSTCKEPRCGASYGRTLGCSNTWEWSTKGALACGDQQRRIEPGRRSTTCGDSGANYWQQNGAPLQ